MCFSETEDTQRKRECVKEQEIKRDKEGCTEWKQVKGEKEREGDEQRKCECDWEKVWYR